MNASRRLIWLLTCTFTVFDWAEAKKAQSNNVAGTVKKSARWYILDFFLDVASCFSFHDFGNDSATVS